jgi:hypothetical protein
MNLPAERVLAAVEDDFPPEVVGPRARDQCRLVARGLPDVVSSYYVECRLDADPQVDFLVQMRNPHGTAARFEQALPAPRSQAWQRNLALFHGWGRRGATLADAPFLWLEYDLDARFDSDAPQASPSIGLERGYLARFHSRAAPDTVVARRLAGAALQLLGGPAGLPRSVERCFAALPPGGSVIYLSWMTTRQPALLKLYISVPKRTVFGYLEAIGWRGNEGVIRAVLDTYFPFIDDDIFLDISLDDGPLPRLGLALSQLHARELNRRRPAWEWLRLPAACADKWAALAAWPAILATTVEGQRTWIQRWLDLKVVTEVDGETRVKAYLGFMPGPPAPFA